MSDAELIARLRELGDHASFEPHMHHKAATRIEALITERDEYHSEAMTYIEKWGAARKAQDEAEAKLAENKVRLRKAVGALGVCAGHDHDCVAKMRLARATLAEIKGESHE